jgi:hypothetical protein
MKTILLTAVIFLASHATVNAQNTTHHLEFEIDPLAYSIGGASGHAAYTCKNERIQLGYGQLTLPESMRNHEKISESFKAISLKWDYFFGKDGASKGFSPDQRSTTCSSGTKTI